MKRTLYLILIGAVSLAGLGLARFDPTLIGPSRSSTPPSQFSNPTPVQSGQVDAQAVRRLPADARLAESYGKLPLSFEVNQGQTDAQVRFLSRGKGYALFLTGGEAVLSLRGSQKSDPGKLRGDDAELLSRQAVFPTFGRFLGTQRQEDNASRFRQDQEPESQVGSVVRMKLAGANRNSKVAGLEELPGKSNYFIGNDPKKWRTNVATYAKVKYSEVYPGIDLVYYGNQGQLEYDFVVAPGADPRAINLAVEAGSQRAIWLFEPTLKKCSSTSRSSISRQERLKSCRSSMGNGSSRKRTLRTIRSSLWSERRPKTQGWRLPSKSRTMITHGLWSLTRC
jgi:hypothetical protein